MKDYNSKENKHSRKSKKRGRVMQLRIIFGVLGIIASLMSLLMLIFIVIEQKNACFYCGGILVAAIISMLITKATASKHNDPNRTTDMNEIATLKVIDGKLNRNVDSSMPMQNDSNIDNNSKLDETNTNNIVDTISEYIENYKKNDQVLTIVNNFVVDNRCNVFVLEFAVLPLEIKYIFNDRNKKTYKLMEYTNSSKEQNQSDYIRFVNSFTQSVIDENKSQVSNAYFLRDYTGIPNLNIWLPTVLKEQFLNAYNLFLALQHQSIINVSEPVKEAYYAFLYLIYIAKKHSFCNSAKELLESYGLSNNDSTDKIIEKLYKNDIEEGIISFNILAVNSEKYNFLDIWNERIKDVKQMVSTCILSIKEKESIQKLSKRQNKEVAKFDINDIDLMSGSQFEWFVSYLFTKLGYSTEITKTSGDQGIDVIAKRGEAVVAIQTKCYSKPVGNHAIMEAVAGAKYYNATKTMVITNNVFTKSACELAKANNVVLWDRVVLKEKIDDING